MTALLILVLIKSKVQFSGSKLSKKAQCNYHFFVETAVDYFYYCSLMTTQTFSIIRLVSPNSNSRNHRFWSSQRLGFTVFSTINISRSRSPLEIDRLRSILGGIPFEPWTCNRGASRCFLSRWEYINHKFEKIYRDKFL